MARVQTNGYSVLFYLALAIASACMILGMTGSSEAHYRETCKAKYQTQEGWSETYSVECNYLSGAELNTSTKSFGFDAFGTYAVIFWAEHQATVIRISTFLTCGMNPTVGCAKGILGLEGSDQEGRSWKICDPTMFIC